MNLIVFVSFVYEAVFIYSMGCEIYLRRVQQHYFFCERIVLFLLRCDHIISSTNAIVLFSSSDMVSFSCEGNGIIFSASTMGLYYFLWERDGVISAASSTKLFLLRLRLYCYFCKSDGIIFCEIAIILFPRRMQ